MASGALFGGSASRSSSKNLVEFRAGKMFMKEKMVHADKRKGLVYVHQSEDSLMHFCWKDRTNGTIEDVRNSFKSAMSCYVYMCELSPLRHYCLGILNMTYIIMFVVMTLSNTLRIILRIV